MIDGYVWLFGFLGAIAFVVIAIVIVRIAITIRSWKEREEPLARAIVPGRPAEQRSPEGAELAWAKEEAPGSSSATVPPSLAVLVPALGISGALTCPCGERATVPPPRIVRSEGIADFIRRTLGAPHRFSIGENDPELVAPVTCATHAPLLIVLASEQILQVELQRAQAVSQAESALARWETDGWRPRLASFISSGSRSGAP